MIAARRLRPASFLVAGALLAVAAGYSGSLLAQSPAVTSPVATNVRDNIAGKIENIQRRQVRGGTVFCRGNRAGQRPTLRCDLRFIDPVSVLGVEIEERGNPANRWTVAFRPHNLADDETVFLLMVDRSDPARLDTVRRSARDLADIFRQSGPRQRVAVASFDGKLDFLQDFTTDKTAVASALEKIQAGGQMTDLYRLSIEGMQRLAQTPGPRKVLVIATDGKAEDKDTTLQQVIETAQRLNIRIVTIGYYETQRDLTALKSLTTLADQTQGFYVQSPGPRLALAPRTKLDFPRRLIAGVLIEAEAPEKNIPQAVNVSIRHPEGGRTSFSTVLSPGVASPSVNGEDQATPMGIDYEGYFNEVIAWFSEDITRIAGVLIAIAIILIGFIITGSIRRSVRRRKAAAAKPEPVPAPRILQEDAPTSARPSGTAPAPAWEEPKTSAGPAREDPRTAFSPVDAPTAARPVDAPTAARPVDAPTAARPAEATTATAAKPKGPAPATQIRETPPIAFLEFNGEPGTVPVRKERVAIGRETDNDVVTDPNELTVSRHHAVLWVGADGTFQIINRTKEYRDQINPILVNGAAVESGKLTDGDVVKLGTGNYGFLFRDARGTTAPRRS